MAENNFEDLSRDDFVRQTDTLEDENVSQEDRLILSSEADEDVVSPKPKSSGKRKGSAKKRSRKKHSRVRDYLAVLRAVIASMVTAAAVVVLVVYFFFPVMRIYGSSMSSTLVDGDIVISQKTTELQPGDICAFYSGSRILCKRVIGLEGDVIEIDDKGTVFVNGAEIYEPYLKGRSLGECNIEFPFTVPEDSYFVLGDNRRESIDSRNTAIGCISKEQMVGRLLFCVLPFPSFGKIK